MFKKKLFLTMFLFLAAFVFSATAMAATSVSWLSPADGSTHTVGTFVNPQGTASGSGTVGGTGLDLMLVIDTSGSMGTTGMNAAKTAAVALINSLPDNTTQVGIVQFNYSAGLVRQLIDLTANKTDLIAAVNSLTSGGMTAMGDGIALATTQLTGSNAIFGHAKMQVVLADGGSNQGQDYLTAAQAAGAAGITVHAVGVPGHNATQMSAIASATGGVYTNVTTLDALEGIFSGTGGNLVGLDHVDIKLPDGTWINDIGTDGLGNFTLPDWAIALGGNTFIAHAYRQGYDPNNLTSETYATATLTLNGINDPNTTIPEPTTMLLFGVGLLGIAGVSRRRK